MLQTLGTIAEFLCALPTILLQMVLVTLVVLVARLIEGGVWEATSKMGTMFCVEEDVKAGGGAGACVEVGAEVETGTGDEAEVDMGGVYGTVTGIMEDLWNGKYRGTPLRAS